MAAITITRNINSNDSLLVSVFQRNSMEFRCERGSEVGTYATVKFGNYEFRAIKKATYLTFDEYIIDVTSILPNMSPIPLFVYNLEVVQIVPVIRLYNSSNTIIATANHPTILLSYGYDDVYNSGSILDIPKIVNVYNKGVSRVVYHNGKMSFFWKGTSAVHPISCGGVSVNYEMYANEINIFDFSIIALPKTGTITSSGQTDFSIPIYYKPPYGDDEIAWLNRDGGWSFWNFRKVSEEIVVNKSNEVATYYPTNAATISKSRLISADKIIKHAFDTLAYDPVHFAQLCEIQESLAVIWNDKLVRVASSNSLTAVCKQNLRFNLVLEVDENIAGY